MSSQVLQVTPHIVGLIHIVLRHELTGCQSSKLIHLQTVGEILGHSDVQSLNSLGKSTFHL